MGYLAGRWAVAALFGACLFVGFVGCGVCPDDQKDADGNCKSFEFVGGSNDDDGTAFTATPTIDPGATATPTPTSAAAPTATPTPGSGACFPSGGPCTQELNLCCSGICLPTSTCF